jgi:hypothetical protein
MQPLPPTQQENLIQIYTATMSHTGTTTTGTGSGMGMGTGGSGAPPPNGKLTGMPPEVFMGNQVSSMKFLRQFKMYQAINEDVSVMQEPGKRVVTFLSFVQGPLVNNWVATMVQK